MMGNEAAEHEQNSTMNPLNKKKSRWDIRLQICIHIGVSICLQVLEADFAKSSSRNKCSLKGKDFLNQTMMCLASRL